MRSESAEVFIDHYTELEREEPVEPAQTWHYKIISGREYNSSSAWPDDVSLCWLVVDEETAKEFVAKRVDAAGVPLAVSALETSPERVSIPKTTPRSWVRSIWIPRCT